MANDLDLLAIELKQYTINLLNLLGKEVEEQFRKWDQPRVGFLDKLTAAHSDAAADQVNVLKEEEEEKRRAFERALFVLNLIGVGATAWLGATLELKVGPKIFYEYESNLPVILPTKWLRKTADEFQSKIFGDMSKDLADLFFELAGEKLKSASNYTEADPVKVVYTPNANVFGQKLFEEVDRQREFVANDIEQKTQYITRSATFGQALVARLIKKSPHLARQGRSALTPAGYKMIDDLFDSYRNNNWAKWHYYAYDPPKPQWPRVKREFEEKIWALWVLQQQFHSARLAGSVYSIAGASGYPLNESGGFASEIKESPIVTRLFDLNAPLMSIKLHGAPTSEDDVLEQVNKLNLWARNMDHTILKGLLEGTKRDLKISQLFP